MLTKLMNAIGFRIEATDGATGIGDQISVAGCRGKGC
jgi:hypothetical protein